MQENKMKKNAEKSLTSLTNWCILLLMHRLIDNLLSRKGCAKSPDRCISAAFFLRSTICSVIISKYFTRDVGSQKVAVSLSATKAHSNVTVVEVRSESLSECTILGLG